MKFENMAKRNLDSSDEPKPKRSARIAKTAPLEIPSLPPAKVGVAKASKSTKSPVQNDDDEKVVKAAKGKLAAKENEVVKDSPVKNQQVKKASSPKMSKSALKVGSQIPDITLVDDEGNAVNLQSEAQHSGLVIFFYPRASTPGCTTQACIFSDRYSEFQGKGFKVFGCSADTVRYILQPETWNEQHYFNFGITNLGQVSTQFPQKAHFPIPSSFGSELPSYWATGCKVIETWCGTQPCGCAKGRGYCRFACADFAQRIAGCCAGFYF